MGVRDDKKPGIDTLQKDSQKKNNGSQIRNIDENGG